MELQKAMYEVVKTPTIEAQMTVEATPEFTREIKKAVLRSQRTQRNWDLSKQLSQEQLDMIIHAATECPTKQNIPFYSLKVIQDREIIEAIYDATYGPAPSDTDTKKNGKKNPQVLANTLLVFTKHDFSKDIGKDRNPETAKSEEKRTEHEKQMIREDTVQAIGIAAGYVNLTASLMGLQTGCCKCMMTDQIQEILGTDEKPMLLMGVGFAQKGTPRRKHHETGETVVSYNKKIAVELL